ncbi:MAG: protoheme IX farnesyltransferase [Ignavibacteriaceae bacterium]|nr:protoheme IX farnesyltransferase [Ignavibacteriaceae bacterium]
MQSLKAILELSKIRITFFVMLTTTFGYLCYEGNFGIAAIIASLGIFLMACGSAALNHIQEYQIDSKMNRTKNRPLPSGKISLRTAVLLSVVLSISGFLVLFIFINLTVALLGLAALLVYNGIYTPMKRFNSLAIFPGSLIGAIPPVVGWVAAGGSILDYQAFSLAFFFFIWQIPHFWLLLLLFGNEYKDAGFPTLLNRFTRQQLSRITFMWIIATIAMGLLLPLFLLLQFSFSMILVLGIALLLLVDSFKLLSNVENNKSYSFAFRHINFFVLAVVISISIDKLR